jgi:hypothetical protein
MIYYNITLTLIGMEPKFIQSGFDLPFRYRIILIDDTFFYLERVILLDKYTCKMDYAIEISYMKEILPQNIFEIGHLIRGLDIHHYIENDGRTLAILRSRSRSTSNRKK